MKLTRLEIIAVAGLKDFPVVNFGPGLNVVFALNGRGKSTMGQLIHEGLFELPGRPRGEAELSWHSDRDPQTRFRQRLKEKTEPFPWANQRPSAAHAAGFFLRAADLLSLRSEHDPDLALALRKAMAGGVDLEQLRQHNEVVLPRREPKLLAEASRALKAAEDRQKRLSQREDNLQALRQRAQAAKDAENELPRLESRWRLIDLAEQISAVEEKLARLPDALQELPDGAHEHRKWLSSSLRDAEKNLEDCSRLLLSVRERLQHLGPKRQILSRSQLTELKQLEQRLGSERRQQEEAEAVLVTLRGRLRALRAAPDLAMKDIDAATLRSLAQASEQLAQQRHRLAALKALIGSYRRESKPHEDDRHLERMTQVLRSGQRLATDPSRSQRLFAIAGVCAAAAGALWILSASSALLRFTEIILASSLTLGLYRYCLDLQQQRRRQQWLVELNALNENLDSVDPGPESLNELIERLQTQVNEAQRCAMMRRRADALALEARSLQQSLQVDSRKFEKRQAALPIEIDPSLPMWSLAHYDELVRHQNLRVKVRAAEAQRDHAEDGLDALWLQAAELSRAAGTELPENLDQLEAALSRLEDENQQLSAWRLEEETLLAERSRRRAAFCKAQEAEADFHQALGIAADDDESFNLLLHQLPEFQELGRQLSRLQAIDENERSQLIHRPDLLELGREDCRERLQTMTELASQAEVTREEIATLLSDLEQCRGGDEFERQLAARDSAAAALEARRDEAMKAAVKTFILKDLMHQLEEASQPQVLRRARELFAKFNNDRCELVSASAAEFRVRDRKEGQLRFLSELSDGTRVQLLMAARLAFAESVELDEKIPIILDECLINSDPQRFAAVVDVLLQQAEQGRQIIYFSSNPDDARAILTASQARPAAQAQLLTIDPLPETRSAPRRTLPAREAAD